MCKCAMSAYTFEIFFFKKTEMALLLLLLLMMMWHYTPELMNLQKK